MHVQKHVKKKISNNKCNGGSYMLDILIFVVKAIIILMIAIATYLIIGGITITIFEKITKPEEDKKR